MKNFITTTYKIRTEKITNPKGVRFAFLTDLHGTTFGEENELLLEALEREAPDAVLLTGDMMVRSEPSSLKTAENLLKHIVNRYKVYYSLGNHEYKLFCGDLGEDYRKEYLEYEESLKNAGVVFLHNEKAEFTIDNDRFTIYGLEIPMIYYRKPDSPELTMEKMEEFLGRPEPEGMNLLLAHNPKYGKSYFKWGADLTLSGHYHGGMLRLTKHRGLISPQFCLFPPFCCGDFHKDKRHMIVSAGLGEHTIPVRIHNPRELVVIELKPLEKRWKHR